MLTNIWKEWKQGGGSNAPVAPPASSEEIRGAAWASIGSFHGGIPYNPEAKFLELARGMGLGAPLTPEIELSGVVLQGFAQGILWARAGDWGNVDAITW